MKYSREGRRIYPRYRKSPAGLCVSSHLFNLIFFYSQYSFRVPTRLTLPEAKKQAWFADLANPEIPLYRLGKSVPHGVRGPELLDVLHASNVPIGRAVWFVRVLGCIETVRAS